LFTAKTPFASPLHRITLVPDIHVERCLEILHDLVNLLPLVAYFVPMPAQLLAGILPVFRPMRAFWAAADQAPIWPFLIAGALSGLAALVLTVRMFEHAVGTRS
jgi:hypothetical protein